MNYPGPGTEINGSLLLYPSFQTTSIAPYWAVVGADHKLSMGFRQSTGATLYYLLPKLAAGDVWTAAYLTGYISINITDATPQFVSRMGFYLSAGNPVSNYGAGLNPGPSLVGGVALAPTTVGFLFPDLRANFAQGIAKPVVFDGTLNNVGAFYSPVTQDIVDGMNRYNANGVRGLYGVSGSGGAASADFGIDLIQWDRGDTVSTIYNPVLTLFSALQYAWIQPSAGGFTIAPELLALGMFGRGRRA